MNTTIDTRPPSGNERLVYSVAEAGALLGISRAFAYELVARGELPVIRLGRRRLVPKAALIASSVSRQRMRLTRRALSAPLWTSTKVSTPQLRGSPGRERSSLDP
jgi:excisionase family DNA binding protein